MYEDLKGKRLLVVGAASSDLAIIRVAHDLGMYVISVDGNTDYSRAPGKREADEAWDINYADTDAIVARCKQEPVDGIIAGYSEFRVLAACRITEKLGLPFYATEEQILLTRNKRLFKDACQRYGVKIPKDYCFSYPVSEEDKARIEYPAIVKPADYGGRKGITVVETADKLDAAIELAAEKSESKTIIIEQYLVGTEFAAIYTLADGKISLSCLNEKYIANDQERVSGLCAFVLTPAFFLDRFLEEADQPLKNFLEGIGARNGVAFFQGMYTPEGIYVFEMGYRVNGNNDFKVVDRIHGINFMKMLINYSVNGTMGPGIEKDDPNFPCYIASVPINLHAGRITTMNYDKLYEKDGIYNVHCFTREGNTIVEDGTTQQKAMLLSMTDKTVEGIGELFSYAYDHLEINDERGETMLFRQFDFSEIMKNHQKN